MAEDAFHISRHGNDATLCGWGPTTEHEIYSNSLHCMNIGIETWKKCYAYNSNKGYNYQTKYHCGFEGFKGKLTLVITLKYCVFSNVLSLKFNVLLTRLVILLCRTERIIPTFVFNLLKSLKANNITHNTLYLRSYIKFV